jgi:hypothetical protein
MQYRGAKLIYFLAEILMKVNFMSKKRNCQGNCLFNQLKSEIRQNIEE